MHSRYWTPEEDKIIIDAAKNGISYKTISHLVGNRSRQAICRRVRYLGVESSWQMHPKYSFDRDYFDTLTPESCYWAGMMQTDGHVNKRRGSMLAQLGFSEDDRTHLELFKQMTKAEQPIKRIMKKCQLSTSDTEKEHPFCYIRFESAKSWTDALDKHYGITINKTLRSRMPDLPNNLLKLSFMRGLMDGDGYVTVGDNKGGSILGICGANRDIILWFMNIVESLGLPTLSRRPRNIMQPEGEACYYYRVGGLMASVLFELFRRLPTPGLSRKWEDPRLLAITDYWKSRKDLWPSDIFFNNILNS